MKFFSRDNVLFLKKNFQIIYAVILLILIPAGLVLNSVLFIKNTQNVIDVELQRKANLANGIASEYVDNFLTDATALQSKIERLAQNNEEIKSLDVLVKKDDDFQIVASLDKSFVGKTSKYLNNTIAWTTDKPVAFQTTSPSLSAEQQELFSNQRFWVVVNPVHNEAGQKVALVSMKVSSQVIDALVKDNLTKSIIVLVATVLVVILLLATNSRLFQYAVLFRKMKEVDLMKDEFISMASHELRAPITGIRGYLEMILDKSFGELPKVAEEKLKLVHRETKRLHDLVEDLLDVSRIEQGRVKLNPQPVNLPSVADEIFKSFEKQVSDKGLKLEANIKTDLPKVYADENKLKQVLVNLMSNAVKYTFKGKIILAAEPVEEKTIKIKISDTGLGMTSKQREHLFEKFYRIRNEKTDSISGTGLGLWITKQLVLLMNGEIYVDSIENVGTQVTVLLPIYREKKK